MTSSHGLINVEWSGMGIGWVSVILCHFPVTPSKTANCCLYSCDRRQPTFFAQKADGVCVKLGVHICEASVRLMEGLVAAWKACAHMYAARALGYVERCAGYPRGPCVVGIGSDIIIVCFVGRIGEKCRVLYYAQGYNRYAGTGYG